MHSQLYSTTHENNDAGLVDMQHSHNVYHVDIVESIVYKQLTKSTERLWPQLFILTTAEVRSSYTSFHASYLICLLDCTVTSIFKITNRVLVEGKSSVCDVMCLKYRIIAFIYIIISLGQIVVLYFSNTSHTYYSNNYTLHTHGLRNNSCTKLFTPWRHKLSLSSFFICCFFVCLAQSVAAITAAVAVHVVAVPRVAYEKPWPQWLRLGFRSFDGSPVINRDRSFRRRWFIRLNTCAASQFSRVVFDQIQVARQNWDANSWEEGPAVDTNMFMYLPRK